MNAQRPKQRLTFQENSLTQTKKLVPIYPPVLLSLV